MYSLYCLPSFAREELTGNRHVKDLHPEFCKQNYTGYTSSEERQWLEISKQTVRVESRGRETSVPGVKSFCPVSSTIPGPSWIIFPPFWEVTVLQNVAEIIHWVGTKLSWVGVSIRTILDPCTQASGHFSWSAARGCHMWEQGRNLWVKLHFLYLFKCIT